MVKAKFDKQWLVILYIRVYYSRNTYLEKKKNVIASCVYRTPGSSIGMFREWMENVFAISNQKVIFVCGDDECGPSEPKEA